MAMLKARKDRGAPLVTIGSRATRAALEAPGNAPIIACMVVDAQDLQGEPNATGVLLEFPIAMQLEWIRRFSPKSQSIGVLYNPEENQERIDEAKQAAERLGLRLVAREVRRPQDLPGALDSLAREADLLWGLTDQTVLSRQTAQAILLFSFRNRMPFTGLSASWVKAGALYALDRDYHDLGVQCGEMAMKVMQGRRVSTLPPAVPRKVVYALNLRTADHLKLNLPPELIEGAAEVFR
ncbi:MAG: ABC transporter substrate-binding protein, partial [Gemmatimonadetes bacterium]|nr:ABC transporter substrate-binding protein [Gemmatimonadota bacterium]